MNNESVDALLGSTLPTPKYLYSYRRSLDEQNQKVYAERLLAHRELYFASAWDFNDPFDCRAFKLSEDEYPDPDERQWEEKRIIKKIKNDWRVLCFTKSQKKILMWAHYASGHRGYFTNVRTSLTRS